MSNQIEVVVNENLVADELFEMVKDFPEFKAMGMDEQGEFILHLEKELNKDIEEAWKLLSL
jgi:hypothetical protein